MYVLSHNKPKYQNLYTRLFSRQYFYQISIYFINNMCVYYYYSVCMQRMSTHVLACTICVVCHLGIQAHIPLFEENARNDMPV